MVGHCAGVMQPRRAPSATLYIWPSDAPALNDIHLAFGLGAEAWGRSRGSATPQISVAEAQGIGGEADRIQALLLASDHSDPWFKGRPSLA